MYNILNIQNAINRLRISGAVITTVEIIRLLTGVYSINHGISPAHSPNAQFGKYLKRNAHHLGIRFSHEKSIIIASCLTTTAVWL